MKNCIVLLAGITFGLATLSAHADDLKGSFVASTLTVAGSPSFASNNFSLTPFKIVAGKEYTAVATATSGMTSGQHPKAYTYADTYDANFTKTALTIKDTCADTGQNGCNHDPYVGFTMTFTDIIFKNAILGIVTDPTGYTYGLVGDVLTVSYASNGLNPGNFKLDITPVAPTPEPGSLALLGTGLAGVFSAARRKFRA